MEGQRREGKRKNEGIEEQKKAAPKAEKSLKQDLQQGNGKGKTGDKKEEEEEQAPKEGRTKKMRPEQEGKTEKEGIEEQKKAAAAAPKKQTKLEGGFAAGEWQGQE